MKLLVQVAGYWVLLVVSTVLGFLGKPAEMAFSILAGTLALIFADLDRLLRLRHSRIDADVPEKVETTIADIEPPTEPFHSPLKSNPAPIDDDTLRVMEALRNSRYSWRHLSGLIEETALPKQAVSNSLIWLVSNELVKESGGSKGPIWSLTQKGRNVHAEAAMKS